MSRADILAAIHQPLIVLDSQLRVAYANPAFYRAFQTTPAETERRPLFELGSGQWNVPELRQRLEQILSNNAEMRGCEIRFTLPAGGRVMRLDARQILRKEAQTGFILLACTDVTEPQQAEQALRQSEQRYRIITEMISNYAYEFQLAADGSLDAQWLGGDFSGVTGFTLQESQARGGWTALIHPDDLPLALARQRRLRAGEVDVSEFRLICKDGSIRWIRDYGYPQWDEQQNRVARIFGAVVDISEEKRGRRAVEAQALISQALQEGVGFQELLEQLLRAAQHAVPAADKGSILLADEHGSLRIQALFGYADPRVPTVSFYSHEGYAGRSFSEARPLNIPDARSDPSIRHGDEIAEMQAVQSAIVTPLIVNGSPIGVLALDSTHQTAAFSDRDLELLSGFGSTAALILEHAHMVEDIRQRLRELQALQQVSSALSQASSIETMSRAFIENAVRAVGAAAGSIYLLEESSGDLVARGWFNPQGNWVSGIHDALRHPPGEGVTGRVAASGEIYAFADWRSDPLTVIKPGEEELLSPLRGGIALPLRAGEQIIGVMNIWYDRVYTPGDAEKRLLAAIADMAGNALQRAWLDERTRQRLEELSVLHAASQRLLTTGLEADAVHTAVHRAIEKVMPCEAFVIVLEDPLSQDYDAIYLFDRGGRYPGTRIPRGAGLSGQVIETGETILIPDLVQSNTNRIHFGDPQSVRSVLAVPLRQGEHVFGMISAQSYQPDMYHEGHRSLLETLAAQFSTTLANARLFEETQQRLRELELIASLSATLRSAVTRAELIRALLKQLISQMGADGATFEVVDPFSGSVMIEQAAGVWQPLAGIVIPAGKGLSAVILRSGQPFLTNHVQVDEHVYAPRALDGCNAAIGVPLRSDHQITAMLWIGSSRALSNDDMRLLTSVADMLVNALLRISLFEETRRRVEQLQVLQTIDRIITTSLDLRSSLDALLEETIAHLKVDAAGVLLYNPRTLSLEYAAGQGFHTHVYQNSRVRVGSGQAGTAALERRVLYTNDFASARPAFTRMPLVRNENFVSYCGAPLIAKGQIKGVLEIFQRSSFHPDADWLNFFEALTHQAAIAIDNAQLFNARSSPTWS